MIKKTKILIIFTLLLTLLIGGMDYAYPVGGTYNI